MSTTCPECGGPKWRGSRVCRACYRKTMTGTTWAEGRYWPVEPPDTRTPRQILEQAKARITA